ncbi:ABC transporter ATP-binding protein [Actinomyces trachealis]|uniref:ABC transporter ATP-binding protein n=1 Tax=Actinomyces trachealis TaxID=2763540 RepID=UPI001F25295B|nr:ABC transporter ATP-binding protein [Actinomyces trachealis]
MTTPLLKVDAVTKTYKLTTAIKDIHLTVTPGQSLGLLGPNGAGKTTTLCTIQGAVRPSAGTVSLFGHHPLSLPDAARHVGFAFDGTGLPTSHSVHNHLINHRLANGLSHREIEEITEEFELGPLLQRRIKDLSTGEHKRVSLATAMAGRPQLLILDEPTNGLDVGGAHWLRKKLLAYIRGGGALLISSHILSEVARIVDSVLVIKRSILFDGPLADLQQHGGPTLEDAYLNLVSPNRKSAAA